jgi:hypothetical protein
MPVQQHGAKVLAAGRGAFMLEDRICVGQIYSNIKKPCRAWRITARYDGRYRLERVDNPNMVRYPDAKALQDSHRYVREGY